MNIESLLFKKIHVWIICLLAILAAIVTFCFGVLVADDNGRQRFGALSSVAGDIAGVPETIIYLLTADHPISTLNSGRFDDKSGWMASEAAAELPGYLLLSRYDGNRQRHAVELVRLKDQEVLHTWLPDADQMLVGVPQTSKVASFSRWNTERYRVIHPIALSDGDLIIKDHQSPLFRLNVCSQMVWRNDSTLFHHSSEAVGDGTFWIPTTNEPSSFPAGSSFIDDAITLVNEAGEILETQSVAQAMIDNGLMHLIFSAGGYNKDPIHLNDIEPMHADGPFWKKGDLFLSMRPTSMVMLYRPSTREVIWHKQGPWMAQHDVDIVDDHTISIFSNNAFDKGKGGFVAGTSEIMYYDFETDTVSSPFKEAMKTHDVLTLSEGLSDAIAPDTVMIEEENSGRILIINKNGDLFAEFVNRSDDGKSYRLGWSRYLSQAEGDALAQSVAQASCG